MAARQSKRARKSSDGPQEVEHLSLCRARGERGKRGMPGLRDIIVLLSTYTTCSAVATPRDGARPRAVLWGSGGALWGGKKFKFDIATSQVLSL